MTGNPFKSVTIAGVLTALGTYLLAHFDPTVFTGSVGTVIGGLIGVVLGVVTHHTATQVAAK